MHTEISIVIPFYNEAETAQYLLEEIKTHNPTSEIIAINDGSSDQTLAILSQIDGIRVLNSSLNRGQSSALYSGLTKATGPIIVTMDGDGQNDPADIPKLVEALDADTGISHSLA